MNIGIFRLKHKTILGVMAVSSVVMNSVVAAEFTGLGDLPGGPQRSLALGLSADGVNVVGSVGSSAGDEPFVWSGSTGFTGLGLFSGNTSGAAQDISANGQVVVGYSGSSSNAKAFRWTAADGLVDLGDLPGGTVFSQAFGVSSDGEVIVGRSKSSLGGTVQSENEAFVWTQETGMVGLGSLPGGTQTSTAYAVSSDGQTVVGASRRQIGPGVSQEAFVWTEASGMIGLGNLVGGSGASEALAISPEAKWAAGASSSDFGDPTNGINQKEAVIWELATGDLIELGSLSGIPQHSVATGISADAKVVVGVSGGGGDQSQAFIWDEFHGMRSITGVLTELGLADSLVGWRLSEATGVSADGFTVAGFGINPNGDFEAWRAVVPEPNTFSILFAAGILLALRQRQRTQ